ncbi:MULTISPECIES: hypothetical protein [unclassified Sphingobium]|uniref:hypothetical protein n=1 Tax=unclassified Sphingobium TaxID=2611147 RepID=UPI001EF09D4B|nr:MULTISPECIES: hypothetical protein [unclassified Sphingobium]
MTLHETTIDRSCGISGCEADWLSSRRHEVEDDIVAFNDFAMAQGWGDGLPLIPPTQQRVQDFLIAGGRFPDELIAVLPPLRAECTVEKIAINAVMAGCTGNAMPLLCAAIEAMADPRFDLAGLNATTGSVVPAMIVNGSIRNRLNIPCQAGCLGGVAGPAVAIGRAIRLIMRNVAGQSIGSTSQSVYGTPGRVAGIVFGEWEERSPWAPLAERRGVGGDAVTVYGAMGTANICDVVANSADGFLDMIAKSMAYPGANGFLPSSAFAETLCVINPIWAEVIAKAYPRIEDVQAYIWDRCALPIDWFRPEYRDPIGNLDRIKPDGRVHLVPTPDDVLVMVAGGEGGLHAAMLHSWGTCLTVTRPVETA